MGRNAGKIAQRQSPNRDKLLDVINTKKEVKLIIICNNRQKKKIDYMKYMIETKLSRI